MNKTSRPACECHGQPMLRNGYRPSGRRRWACKVRVAQKNARAIWIGDTYYGQAKTAEARAAIVTWGRRERLEFITNQTKEN